MSSVQGKNIVILGDSFKTFPSSRPSIARLLTGAGAILHSFRDKAISETINILIIADQYKRRENALASVLAKGANSISLWNDEKLQKEMDEIISVNPEIIKPKTFQMPNMLSDKDNLYSISDELNFPKVIADIVYNYQQDRIQLPLANFAKALARFHKTLKSQQNPSHNQRTNNDANTKNNNDNTSTNNGNNSHCESLEMEEYFGDQLQLEKLRAEDLAAIEQFESSHQIKVPSDLIKAWQFSRSFTGNEFLSCQSSKCQKTISSCYSCQIGDCDKVLTHPPFCTDHGLFVDPINAFSRNSFSMDEYNEVARYAMDKYHWIYISRASCFNDDEVVNYHFLDPVSGAIVQFQMDDLGDAGGIKLDIAFNSFEEYLLATIHITLFLIHQSFNLKDIEASRRFTSNDIKSLRRWGRLEMEKLVDAHYSSDFQYLNEPLDTSIFPVKSNEEKNSQGHRLQDSVLKVAINLSGDMEFEENGCLMMDDCDLWEFIQKHANDTFYSPDPDKALQFELLDQLDELESMFNELT